MQPPETFSSEIGGVHERRGDRASFTNEFRGASDSLIEHERPPRVLDIGRRGRRVVFLAILLVALLGGGGFSLWYWSEPIGEWIASWNPDESEPAPEPEPAPEATPEPVEPAEPPKVFGVKGAPEGSEPAPTPVPDQPASPPTSADPPPTPAAEPLDSSPPSQPASVSVASTSVRGQVSRARVEARLAAVDEALKGCWTSAAAKPGTRRPAALTLSFVIKWNGRLLSSSVDGDAPESVEACVREALPSSGWPMPRDGGEGRVSREWELI